MLFFLGNNEPYCAKKKKGCRHGFEQCPPQSSECGKCKKKQICCCKEGDGGGGGGGGGKPHSLSNCGLPKGLGERTPKILHNHCIQLLQGITVGNGYAKFGGGGEGGVCKQGALWYM